MDLPRNHDKVNLSDKCTPCLTKLSFNLHPISIQTATWAIVAALPAANLMPARKKAGWQHGENVGFQWFPQSWNIWNKHGGLMMVDDD